MLTAIVSVEREDARSCGCVHQSCVPEMMWRPRIATECDIKPLQHGRRVFGRELLARE